MELAQGSVGVISLDEDFGCDGRLLPHVLQAVSLLKHKTMTHGDETRRVSQKTLFHKGCTLKGNYFCIVLCKSIHPLSYLSMLLL